MDFIKEVKKLNFSLGEYVIVGSGPMIIRGLKKAHDIDIVATENLFNKCKLEGWEIKPWTYPQKIGQIYLRQGNVEIFKDVNCGNFNPTIKELIERSEIIEGIPFVSLQDMLKFKREYNTEKHLKDIATTEEFLKKQNML
jgi:hypothetical protein